MSPNFNSFKELKEYCVDHNCEDCPLDIDCTNIKEEFASGIAWSDCRSEVLEKLFLYYRKKKLEKLLS